jgi:outer membrane protein assembly factor BamB
MRGGRKLYLIIKCGLFNLRDIKNAIIIKSNTRLIIFCVSYYYNGGMFCLNQSTGVIKWNKQILNPVMASPATIKDKVFFAASDKRIYCFHVEDGSRIWEFETEDKIWSSPSLSEYDGIIFFGSLDSHIYGIDINTGKQTWKFPTMNMLDSSAAIASNMMLIGSRDGLLYIFGSEMAPSYIR